MGVAQRRLRQRRKTKEYKQHFRHWKVRVVKLILHLFQHKIFSMFSVTCKIFQSQTTKMGSSATRAADAGVMSQNSEESTHDALFYGTKTKL